MIDDPPPSTNVSLPAWKVRKQKRKETARELARLTSAKTLSLKLLDLQTEIQLKEYIGKNLSDKKAHAQQMRKLRISAKGIRTELIELGFDVDRCLDAAKAYKAASKDEASSARPTKANGVSSYSLGNQTRHWK
jgi:hypothetical protein